jgi:hypothetical protein
MFTTIAPRVLNIYLQDNVAPVESPSRLISLEDELRALEAAFEQEAERVRRRSAGGGRLRARPVLCFGHLALHTLTAPTFGPVFPPLLVVQARQERSKNFATLAKAGLNSRPATNAKVCLTWRSMHDAIACHAIHRKHLPTMNTPLIGVEPPPKAARLPAAPTADEARPPHAPEDLARGHGGLTGVGRKVTRHPI